MTPVVDTKARILDAAAELFESDGIGATSIRAIIRKAKVNLNAIHYHFGSKEQVTQELFKRVMNPINRERHQALDILESSTFEIADLLYAVYWPLVRRSRGSRRSKEYRGLLIVTQLRHDPSPEATRILEENQADFAPRFERMLTETTGLSEREMRITIRLANAAAWGIATQPALLDDLIRAKDRAARVDTMFDDFLLFATAGIERLKHRPT